MQQETKRQKQVAGLLKEELSVIFQLLSSAAADDHAGTGACRIGRSLMNSGFDSDRMDTSSNSPLRRPMLVETDDDLELRRKLLVDHLEHEAVATIT